ncbi:hypothetical protein G6F43_006588 [Rhizopus delemar]|nr:hypothetical protein G6F43_006588 [Rhizopus delemar]
MNKDNHTGQDSINRFHFENFKSSITISSKASESSNSSISESSHTSGSSDIVAHHSEDTPSVYSFSTSCTSFPSSSKHFYSIVPLAIDKDIQEIMLCGMTTDELQTSIIEIWCKSQLHDVKRRLMHTAWYNWVMLDVARRLQQLYQRTYGNSLVKDTVSEISKRLFCKLSFEGKRFCDHPLFTTRGRVRLLRLANKFGDAVCALSEFVDFMQLMKMADEEFCEFYEELLENKWAISDRMRLAASFFNSKSPLGPFTSVNPMT